MKLKKGDKVYRVGLTHTYDETGRIPEFLVEMREVERASDKQIKLRAFFSGLANIQFEPRVLGRLFFRTPREALAQFRAAQQERIASAERNITAAREAMAWIDKTVRNDLCGYCGRERWMHGTRHDTCVSFVEPTDVTS
jgi:hypothetical protein